MTDGYLGHTPRTRPRLAITAAFGLAVLGAVAFAVSYVWGGNTQMLGAALFFAFAGLAIGLAVWSRRLIGSGGYVEEHKGFSSSQTDQRLLTEDLTAIAHPGRRGLLAGLSLAVLSIGAALLFPLRSLIQPHGEHVLRQLRHTAWGTGGLRLVDTEHQPIRPADVGPDTFVKVFPEGHTSRKDRGDASAFLVRIDPSRFVSPPPADHVEGVVAFSLICTHAGCPVAQFRQTTGQVLCPCHQSLFDLLDAGRPISGPAARSLPGLPITVDANGFLRASGDFTSPPGPGFWSLP